MTSISTARQWLRGTPGRRDRTDAAGVAALGLVLIAVGMVDVLGSPDPVQILTNRWWHALPLLLGCAALLIKRRRPGLTLAFVVVLLAGDVAIGASIGMYVVLLDALYSFVRYVRAGWVRPTLVVVAAVVVAIPTAVFVASGNVQAAAAAGIQTFALLVTPIWWGWSLRQENRLVELERRRADDLRQMTDLRRTQAVREEQLRMARDLHDGLSSNLSAIAIHSSLALTRVDPSAADPSLTEIRAASVRAVGDLREMIQVLQTGTEQSAAAGLDDLDPLIASARATGLSVRVVGDTRPAERPPVSSTVDHAAYRIVQESLVNATKHAQGTHTEIDISGNEDELRLTVTSRPTSPRPTSATPSAPAAHAAAGASRSEPAGLPVRSSGGGLGLRTMQARTSAVGGSFAAGWCGQDWVVRATLPLTMPAPDPSVRS